MLATLLVWYALPVLAWPARVVTTLLLVALPAFVVSQRHMAREAPELMTRRAIYASSAIGVWIIALFCVLAALASGLDAGSLGLVLPPAAQVLGWSAAVTLAGLVVMGTSRLLRIRETPLLLFLLPRNQREKAEFAGVSLSAGIGEELVFRGFLVPALIMAGGSVWLAAAVSSVAFGTMHVYQGTSGVVRTTILGFILAVPFILTGSIVPSVVAHTAINLMAGLWLAEWLLKR